MPNIADCDIPNCIISQKTVDCLLLNVSRFALFASERQAPTTAWMHVRSSSWDGDGVISVAVVIVGVVVLVSCLCVGVGMIVWGTLVLSCCRVFVPVLSVLVLLCVLEERTDPCSA